MARVGITLALLGGSLLACTGPLAGVLQHDLALKAFSVKILRGTVSDERDRGAEGEYSVEAGGLSQSLSWEPAVDSNEEHAQRLYEASRRLVSSITRKAEAEASFSDGTVGGYPGRHWELPLSTGEYMRGSTWTCAEAGVQVSLITGASSKALATELHQKSLDAAHCVATPVALDAQRIAWRFTDSAAAWTPVPEAEEDGVGEWVHADGDRTLRLVHSSSMKSLEKGFCRATLELVRDRVLETATLAPGSESFADTLRGCEIAFEALTDDVQLGYRVRQVDCTQEEGFLAVCVGTAPLQDPEACFAPASCATGALPRGG